MSYRGSLLIITGPTASGKTALALALASKFEAEIVNTDSSQLYSHAPILTAHPSLDEQLRVPHHLFGVLSPEKKANVGWFIRSATEVISRIESRGAVPLLVGGTGMYLTSLLHGLHPLPSADEELRAELEQYSNQQLYHRLSELDPNRASELHPNDRNRVIRAIEVVVKSGSSMTEVPSESLAGSLKKGVCILICCWRRDSLYHRIDQRVDQLLSRGAIQEVQRSAAEFGERCALSNAIGYREIWESFQSGNDPTPSIAQATRRFAKRQMTFFRNEPKKRGWEALEWEGSRVVQLLSEQSAKSQNVNRKHFAAFQLPFGELVSRVKEALSEECPRIQYCYLDAEFLLETL